MKAGIILGSILIAVSLCSCDKEVSVSKPEDPPQNSGRIFVNSVPPHAAIYLNQRNTGFLTPDTVPYLDDGNYLLTLKIRFYKDSSGIIPVHKDSTSSIFFDFVNNPTMRGDLYLDSNPRNTSVFLNDSLIAEICPVHLDSLLPGEYAVRFEANGFWSLSSTAVVRSAKTTRISANLKDTLIWVNFNSSHGIPIPTDYLTCVAADGNTIWAGSFTGLIKYENNEWQHFNIDNSPLPADMIYDIVVDEQGIKWICTEEGLVKINGENWTIYNTSNSGLPDNRIVSVAFENNSVMWVGLKSNGAAKYDGVNWTIYDHSVSPLPTNDMNYVAVGPDGSKWFCTNGGGLTRFYSDSLWKTYNNHNTAPAPSPNGEWKGFPSNIIHCINFDDNNIPWVGLGKAGQSVVGGSSYFEGPIFWHTFPSLPSINVLNILKDYNGVLWFANEDGGLSKFVGSFYSFTTSNSNLESNRIYDLTEDESHNIWLASYGGGLVKYKGNR